MMGRAFDDSVRYALASRHYLGNALGFLQRGEAGKASEFLWGSFAEIIKAVGTSRGKPAPNHNAIRRLAATFAREAHKPIISQGLGVAENLHSNFHEVDLDVQDVGIHVETIKEAVAYLYSLLPLEIRAEVENREMQQTNQASASELLDTTPNSN